ncbi:tRNA lysidine(34) synthetase TilS C-terminal domain-containing protein [Thermoclostridium stercorarium]|uniref:tRNA lysidine(34) synthetase TilS C-terminal domain-containing protein n=1 Tax=Thermoclostridium stercorarium TaxID=1510 RepID=UPI0025AF3C23|nr:tRNA lysidine(34) synthetase TilS C-terminal domain-containing protein [Thermoclostridium stercorarium]
MDLKIPKKTRENILLLAEGKNIIWVVGYRTSDNYKIEDSTETILYVNITRQGNNFEF